MTTIFDAAFDVQTLCEAEDWSFCFIGGLAVQRWAEPRFTADVDVTILTGYGGETPVVDRLLERYEARIDDPVPFARRNRVVLLETAGIIGIDVSLGAVPFEERIVERASDHELVPGQQLRICSAEDLVVLKAFAGRPVDWSDIGGVVARSGQHLDVDLVLEEASVLLEIKEAPEDLARLRALLGRLDGV